jgi:hypothetical protein
VTIAEQLRRLKEAKRAVSGVIRTPKRSDPYLEVDLLSLEGKVYWRQDRGVYELVGDSGSETFRSPEMLLRHCRVRGRRAVSD